VFGRRKPERFGMQKLEVYLVLLLFFIQIGLPMINIQPSFWFGLICWIIITLLSLHIIWLWERTGGWGVGGRILSSLIGMLLLGAYVLTPLKEQWNREHMLSASVRAPTRQLMLEGVDGFIAGRDEMGLRQLFGMDVLLGTNVLMIGDRIRYFRTGGTSWDINRYVEKGGALLMTGDIPGERLTHKLGTFEYAPRRREVAIIVLPARYQQAKATLRTFGTSALLPDTVVRAVNRLNDAVDIDSSLMLHALDRALRMDENYYLKYTTSGSRYFHAIDGMVYNSEFVQLYPKAEELRSSVRGSFNAR